MIYLRFACALFACLFFIQANAQDTIEIHLKACPQESAPNDPSIVIKKSVQANRDCNASPLEVEIFDERFGFAYQTKTIGNLSSKPWAIEASQHDVFKTHKPCRRLFPDRGRMIEWLVPLTAACDGREPGWYFRVFTKDKVCVMPGESCTSINDPETLPKQRFDEAVGIAYRK